MADPQPAAAPVVDPLRGLRAEHPRLYLTGASIERIRRRAAEDAGFAARVAALRANAEALLGESVCTYSIPDGRRLLLISRMVLARVQTLGLFALLDNDRRFADRAWRELEAAAAFPDWNPSHFLDTAEMANAFGLGFDWLHGFLDETQRSVLVDAIVRHAFTPAEPVYRAKSEWLHKTNNWNVVCNGGLGVAALAVAEREPVWARRVLAEAVEALPYCLRHFAPDGGWPEGAGYWVYTHEYLSYFLAACETALGHDFGLGDLPGLDRSSQFIVHLATPAPGSFNFADCGDRPIYSAALLYHARRYGVAAAAEHQLRSPAARAFDLIWHPDHSPAGAIAALPRDYFCRGVECLTVRSAWDDPRADFLGIQCGRNPIGHNRLDKGGFVYASRGVRWFLSLPADDYNQRGFFGDLRYHYYRNRAEAHNTLVINPGPGVDQDPSAGGEVTRYASDEAGVSATMDLLPCYPWAGQVQRRVDYRRRGGVTLTDEVEAKDGGPMEVWWFAHTRARVELDASGRRATLHDDHAGETLGVELVEPARARFLVMPAQPLPSSPNPEGQNPNDGTHVEGIMRVLNGPPVLLETPNLALATRKLAVHLEGERRARIVVRWGA